MDANKNLIVFAEDWGRFPTSTQSLVTALLKRGWCIVWINSIGLRKPSFSSSYLHRVLEKVIQYVRGKTSKYRLSLPKNLTVINPIIIPFIGIPIFDKLNRFILKKQLSPIRKSKQFDKAIIWTTLPTAYPLIEIFDGLPLVYYCCDDYSVLGDSPNPQVSFFEEKLIQQADLIVVVSETLAVKMPRNKTYYLDHAIDVSLFTKSYPRPKDLPHGKPIAGFYGSLSSWVDMNLIFQCATNLRNWNFVFIGPKQVSIEKLETLSNFFYLGSKSYIDIPAYSQHWDVGLIPFIKNQLTDACNPLKIKEYLAAGKPVVSIDIPALRIYKDFIYIAKDSQDFLKGIELSLTATNDGLRKNLVKDQSWDARALTIEKKLLDMNSIS
jgi:glycosyltransferase involved in cell wall biosynthesis